MGFDTTIIAGASSNMSRLTIENHPTWIKIQNDLNRNKSLMLCMPITYGVPDAIENLRAHFGNDSCIASLNSSGQISTGRFDWQECWNDLCDQLGFTSNESVRDGISFRSVLSRTIKDKLDQRLVIIVEGASTSNVLNHCELLRTFDSLLRIHRSHGHLQVVAFDDYSTFFFQKRNQGVVSELEWFDYYKIGHIPNDIVKSWTREYWSSKIDHKPVIKFTGGHLGLLNEFARMPNISDNSKAIREYLLQSTICERVADVFKENPADFENAIKYYSKGKTIRSSNHIDQTLFQLGVLTEIGPGRGAVRPKIFSEIATAIVAGGHQEKAKGAVVVSESRKHIKCDDSDIVIVQLSDLHFGPKHDLRIDWGGGKTSNSHRPYLQDLIVNDLRDLGIHERVDALLINGDLTESGLPQEFRQARKCLEQIVAALGVDGNSLLVIGGNHDVTWVENEKGEWTAERIEFSEFLKDLRKNDLALDSECILITSRCRTRGLQIVGLDSNAVEGPEAAGIGFVSHNSLTQAAKQQEKLAAKNDFEFDKWIMVHHHVLPVTSALASEAAKRKVSVLANAPSVLHHARQWGVSAILHGHQHQPFISFLRSWPTSDKRISTPIAVIGAGSAAVGPLERGPAGRNHYFILQSKKDEIVVHSRMMGEHGEEFTFHNSISIPQK